MLGHRAQIGLDADVAGCGWMVIATSPGAVCLLSVLAVELQTTVCKDFTITEEAPTRSFSWSIMRLQRKDHGRLNKTMLTNTPVPYDICLKC